MAREALTIVGSAVQGFIVGGWYGAAIGAGAGIASVLLEPKIRAPGVSEAPSQTSRDGVPIPIVWGLHFVHGNIIQKNPEVIVTSSESQGKGGGTKVEKNQRFRTFAIGIAEGPIASIVRIWENGKLVYDTRPVPAIPAAETAEYAAGITIYFGDMAQLPDPELESHWTAAETPAYRGLCYIVWNNKDLTETGGAIPQFGFEINSSAHFLGTSRPYAQEWTDGMDNAVTPPGGKVVAMPFEGMDNSVTPNDGLLGGGLVEYIIPAEGMDNAVTPNDGLLGGGLVEYIIPAEGMDNTVTPNDGLLGSGLIEYIIPAEGMDNAVTPNDGTLT